ncbi:hypothetical protein LJR231_002793 [Phyllobacterium sp. LjRoot231]|uniref:hypothetical protein n=1 Tax=Phyllobacterium sp. LjRoot231 TaxID=3342289 RepID=UPI003ED1666D
MVPAHADANPEQPLPEPEGQRFRGFRTEFGRAVAGAGAGSFVSALGKYARDSTGGASFGPRRFGPAYSAGGALIGLLNELQAGGTGENSTGIDLSGLVGQPVGEAIDAIAQALAPPNADQDLIRIAMQEALAEVLPDVATFDPTVLQPDDLISLLVEFFSRVLFQEVTADAGEAWNKSDDPFRTVEAENELMDIIRASVDRHLSPSLAEGIGNLSRAQIEQLERRAIDDIWSEWERYE